MQISRHLPSVACLLRDLLMRFLCLREICLHFSVAASSSRGSIHAGHVRLSWRHRAGRHDDVPYGRLDMMKRYVGCGSAAIEFLPIMETAQYGWLAPPAALRTSQHRSVCTHGSLAASCRGGGGKGEKKEDTKRKEKKRKAVFGCTRCRTYARFCVCLRFAETCLVAAVTHRIRCCTYDGANRFRARTRNLATRGCGTSGRISPHLLPGSTFRVFMEPLHVATVDHARGHFCS